MVLKQTLAITALIALPAFSATAQVPQPAPPATAIASTSTSTAISTRWSPTR